MLRFPLPAVAAAAALVLGLSAAGPVGLGAAEPVTFTEDYLNDPANVELGRQLWGTRCTFCHGRMAYPGKAPKLDPSRYTPEFVYDRVTNGFRGMPSWKHEFDEAQRKAIVAYVMSPDFSN